MGRTLRVATIAAVFVTAVHTASAAALQDQSAAFTLSFASQGKPAANVPVRVVPKDGPAVDAGTTTPEGAIDILNAGSMPKGTPAEVYVCTDDSGQEVIVLAQAGVDPSKDPRCRKHRKAGAFVWGQTATVDLGGAPTTTAGGGREQPAGHTLLGTPLPDRNGWSIVLRGEGGRSLLGGVTDQACTNVTNELNDSFGGFGATPTCTDPSGVGMFGVNGGIFLPLPIDVSTAHGFGIDVGGGIGYDTFGTQHLSATLQPTPQDVLNDTADFHVTRVFSLRGEVETRISFLVPYVAITANNWHLDQTAALTFVHDGNSQVLNSGSASDSGWAPGISFGVDIDVWNRITAGIGYSHVTVHKGPGGSGGTNGFSEHVNSVAATVGVRLGR